MTMTESANVKLWVSREALDGLVDTLNRAGRHPHKRWAHRHTYAVSITKYGDGEITGTDHFDPTMAFRDDRD